MQFWHDRIYLGHGDWDKTNAGPIRALYFDLNSEKFVHDDNFNFNDEAIEKFQIFNDTLYAPGADATENWDYGNFYYKQWGGKWNKLRTIPGGIHVWDIAAQGKTLFASGVYGQGAGAAYIWKSTDNGQTWIESYKSAARSTLESHASFFVFRERLYATIARDGCLIFNDEAWTKSNCIEDHLYSGVYKNAIYRNTVVMVPYWNERGNTLDRRLFFFDGQVAWSVAFPLTVTDVVSAEEGLYVLIGTSSGTGSILRAANLDCRCEKDFERIVDFDMSKDRPQHARGYDPTSMVYANGRFYLGFLDGRLFRSKPYQP